MYFLSKIKQQKISFMNKQKLHIKDMEHRRPNTIQEFDTKSFRSLANLKSQQGSVVTNTYKLGPDPQSTFREGKVKKIIEDVLNRYLEKYEYDSKTSGNICVQMANEIKQRTKQLGFYRYKIISHAIMYSQKQQGMKIASRFLWDEKLDRMVSCKYIRKTFGAIVTLTGCYFE